jgi:hypothetical protein
VKAVGEVVNFSAPAGESWIERHRERYFDRKWLVSKRGNRYLRLAGSDGHGCTVTVFRTNEGWMWSIVLSAALGPIYGRQAYDSAVAARQAAWDSLVKVSA